MVKKKCPRCLRVIGDGTRVKIIKRLSKGCNNVTKILEDFSLTQPTVSYHLKILEKNRVVFKKKKGREIYYFLNKKYPCKKCSLLKIPLKL